MKERPLIISLLIGLIVVLVIAGVSFLASIKSLSGEKEELAKEKINIEEENEELKMKNSSLKKVLAN